MAWVAVAVGGGALVNAYVSNKAAGEAASAQKSASQAGIAEQQRQFDAAQELLKPYVEAGNAATTAQADLSGANGPEAQQKAIDMLQTSPQFQALTKQGETSILQNAAATGGLRGGNVQGVLAQFRPQILSQLISDQFNRLGSLSARGESAAAGTGSAAMQTGTNIANLFGQQGAAEAGRYLAQGQAVGQLAQTPGELAMLKALKVF